MNAVDHTPWAKLKEINPHESISIHVKALSPLHLGSGYADIHVDADVVQDDVGLPYFPAKRLKGLLYESGCEVAEMTGFPLFDKEKLDTLFQRGRTGQVQLVMHNLYMENHAAIHDDLKYLEEKYPAIFRPADVLGTYANLRWQTQINRETGVAEATSLHNMRVIEKGVEFSGEIRMMHADMEHLRILALAVRNLSQCGGKRMRGFGRIGCTLRQKGKDIVLPLVEDALGLSGRKGGKR
jgi:CRISPR-associated ramp protein